MASGHYKDKTDPRRWILLSGDYRRDLHRAGVGYFFTVRFLPSVAEMSFLKEEKTFPVLTLLGGLIKTKLRELEERLEGVIKIEVYALMSDHLHLCLWVDKEIKRTPLQLLTTMMIFTEKSAREEFGIPKLWALPGSLYVCYSTARYQEKKKYTLANITRWHLELEHPEYAHPRLLTHPRLSSQYQWEGYGNMELLERPRLLPCYISHAATEKDVELFTRLAISLAQEDWTLVGGFVSPRERNLLKAVRAACTPHVIHLAATRLQDRKLPALLASKLYRHTFLRLTSAEGQETCQRPLCVWQNLWAEAFCGDWRGAVVAFFRELPSTSPQQLHNLHGFLSRWPSPSPAKYRGPRPLPLP